MKGHKIACTQFTPSHFLLLYLLSQSGLSPDDRANVEKNIIFTSDAPAAAAAFKAKQVDAAVTWEPDLSGAVTARGAEAHVLVSTQAPTNIIAAPQRPAGSNRSSSRNRAGFCARLAGRYDQIKNDPNGSYEVVAKALKLDTDTVSGMLSDWKSRPMRTTLSSTGWREIKPQATFDTAFVIWRKKRSRYQDGGCEGLG